ncbi:MAG: acyl carrier protein [Polyangiaceae bacterium]
MARIGIEDIQKDVVSFIVQNYLFGNADGAPQADASFLESGLIDSTGILELIAHVETRYGIKVADEELVPENLDSVARISAFVAKKAA